MMKQILLLILGLFAVLHLHATNVESYDSVEVSLLTCSPGEEIWAQYGHTAIRWHDLKNGKDVVINYGLFSPDVPYFIPRFVFGLTDYRMGVESFELFCSEYIYRHRGVTEQVLALTTEDKQSLAKALQNNLQPENVVYRYNFFYDNCTSRARDIIVSNLHGKVTYPAPKKISFREMLHCWNNAYPWSQFGEDLLLGVSADRPTEKAEQQFLPHNLQEDFAHAVYNGRPLVAQTRQLLESYPFEQESEFPLSPVQCAIVFVIILAVIMAYQLYSKKLFWGIDTLLMFLASLVGIVFTLMIFSQHPCVSANLLIIIFNPLPLFFMWHTVKCTRNRRADYWWTLWSILILVGLLGRTFQSYPPAIMIVAFGLLCYCVVHIYIQRNTPLLSKTK